ncbi:OLC1v1013590C2 [Oldenlandia corymbosa var. corymbosa]|uniref:OLC1v1013590C2 n=1 Tax=Oldenlandia corymbosa var. corymbosa TaxID=529605 RepID=A0AAV1DYL2_OLDCO|nr:OLC1v1013590C2 [Oldenlandia corymbosa var. corymbosa]
MKIKLKLKMKPKETVEEEEQKSSLNSESSFASPEPSASDSVSGGSNLTFGRSYDHLSVLQPNRRRPVLGSTHIRIRAESILRILTSQGCASEVRLRQLLGDSPSTSKALRLLLSLHQVKRCGAGGRNDPYIYMVA